MIEVVGVRFKPTGKIYYFDPEDSGARDGNDVIVETARGLEYGKVVIDHRTVEEESIVGNLKPVVRLATKEDFDQNIDNKNRAKEALIICEEKIKEHGLDMVLIGSEYTFDNGKLLFYFTAEGRIDFRLLVRDLASIFRTRIELRQIGVRDEAKALGGLGCCGRATCCSSFLSEFTPVSIKMAKDQNLSLNPVKISGICGRLMCCLKYEQDGYECVIKKMPRVGEIVGTPLGEGLVVDTFVIQELLKVKEQVDNDFIYNTYSIEEVKRTWKVDPNFRQSKVSSDEEEVDEKELRTLEKD